MNIETIQKTNQPQQAQTTKPQKDQQEGDVKFSDELKTLSKEPEVKEDNKPADAKAEEEIKSSDKKADEKTEKINEQNNSPENPEKAIDGLTGIVEEMTKLNRPEEIVPEGFKDTGIFDDKTDKDKKREEITLIDNNMNIQEPKDRLNTDMNTNMNFSSNGQPFGEFINQQIDKQELKVSAKEVEEEKAILSTMEENIAIANKNMAIQEQPKTKTVTTEHEIKKVDVSANVKVDTIVNFDSVVMDKSDVEFFAKLVNGDVQNLSEIKNPEKSGAVSKTLADLLAKSMENNKPIRINFDNDISVIIRIDRNGKISADFLPSSQIAEAYLRENLPLLRQRFDDNNIDYNELNQRKQNRDNENRKKDRKDE